MLGMAGLAAAVAFTTPFTESVVIFSIVAAIMSVGAIRSLFLGVVAKPKGIVIRGLTSTRTIPWGEIEEIAGGGKPSGASGMLGATAPVVVRRNRRTGKSESIELQVLGGYGVSRVQPTPADRAINDLNAHLEEWKKHQPVAD
jgi:hypothetical protein